MKKTIKRLSTISITFACSLGLFTFALSKNNAKSAFAYTASSLPTEIDLNDEGDVFSCIKNGILQDITKVSQK